MATTMRITAMVVFILIGARVFSLVFQGVGGKVWIEHMLTSLPGGQVGFLIFVNIFIFVIAFFLDFFEIAFIIIPLLAPVADKLGIDLIWFGVLICANIQTSFMHPPFGFALFYLRGIAPPSVKSSDIYWGAIPWVVLQLILVAILIFWPQSVTYWIDKPPGIDPSKVEHRDPAARHAAAARFQRAAEDSVGAARRSTSDLDLQPEARLAQGRSAASRDARRARPRRVVALLQADGTLRCRASAPACGCGS